ncbi:response regulator [Owenweeksia hongkongensis]|uniref:Response regulator containing a CheY-like receiver domain and an HTH DNA-binding domain n=1 Tax=Owenweeksia hongkongensis (strain DSM 17368 / CIP 108786 / JCM 12287 / NRRL B-23963 / UST20020801) TaxID=926562 RepID=G8R6G8_OWEHD|nr:response regulator transcription factor [Owenweeksia hongkongensis]AEV34431.1 response regulator containing a CheY-like receiver domain and an HTH DNA-binding domain [Owenweeksia hongkongensis DSM 17368]
MNTIILAEDHNLIIEGYRMLIDDIDDLEIVATAFDGQQAIDEIEKHQPNYLILDLHMPVVNGLDVLRHVSEYFPKTKVIVISMFGDPSMHQAVVRLGAKGYLLKNSDREEFLLAMSLVMNGKSYYSPAIFEEHTKCQTLPGSSQIIPLVSLSAREEEILILIAQGYTNKEIGSQLILSHKTIDSHRSNLMKKINVHNVTGLVKYAIANGYEV